MGVTAEVASGGVGTGSVGLTGLLDLMSLLSLPGGPLRGETDRQRDLALANENARALLPLLFKGYDRRRPSHTPVQLQACMLVDHIEQLDELQQMLTFHATLILAWEDRRLVWEPSDYGNIRRLAFSSFDLLRFWKPAVSARGVTLMSRNLNQFHNTEYTLLSDGLLFAEISVSLRATCDVDLKGYPNDLQTCSVSLLSPLHLAEEVLFTSAPSFVARETFFAGNNMTMTSGFRLESLDADSYYTYGDIYSSVAAFTVPETDARRTGSAVRFRLRMRRNAAALYVTHVALPLFLIAVVTFTGVLLSDVRASLAWLAICLALQFYVNARGIDALPVAYYEAAVEPICLQVARCLLVETLFLIIYRMWVALQLSDRNPDNSETDSHKSTLIHYLPSMNEALLYFLTAESIFILWLLFF